MLSISHNRIFALIWRIGGLLLGIFGLTLQFTIGGGFMSSTAWIFFTVQTNVITTLQFAVLTVLSVMQIRKSGTRGEAAGFNKSIQLGTTLYISITFIVYWTLLSWQPYGGGSDDMTTKVLSELANVLLHGIVPIFAVLDWILFAKRSPLKKRVAAYWLSYPLLYFAFVAIRAQVGGPLFEMNGVEMFYPYPFIEPNMLGSAWLLIPVVLGLAVAFYALGLLYIYIDKLLYKKFGTNKRDTAQENIEEVTEPKDEENKA